MNALATWRDNRGQAVTARTSGPLIHRAERLPGSIDLADLERLNAQRSYRVEFKQDLHPGSRLRWQMKPYGDGHWCRCDGQPHWFARREDAEAAGETWVRTGRTQP